MDAVTLIKSIVADQLRAHKTSELGVVTAAHPHESPADKNNYEVDVRLRNSGLELKRLPLMSQRIGAVAIPNVDDLVVVTYLNGDINSAVVNGRLYNDVDRPPEAKSHEFVYVSPDAAKSGIRRMHMEFPNGNVLTLDDEKLVVEMGSTRVTVNNGGDVELESNGNVTVSSSGDTTLDVQGSLSLSAAGDVSIEGTNVELKSTANLDLKGGASSTLKGSSVSIAGQTSFSAS